MRGEVYKNYYPINPDLKKDILKAERAEEIRKYEGKLAFCIASFICSECGQPYKIDETWLRDEVFERTISGTCRPCQHKLFGAI